MVKTKILGKQADDWYRFCTDYSSMRVVQACLETISPINFGPFLIVIRTFQVIPGNDQNTIPTNHGATGSKLDRTSQLTFYGSRGHLKSFSGDFLA